jgi:hypothetical protein
MKAKPPPRELTAEERVIAEYRARPRPLDPALAAKLRAAYGPDAPRTEQEFEALLKNAGRRRSLV